MRYVMVPVPEEQVEEVMRFVLRALAQAAIEPWDFESVTQVFGEVDEPSRSLLAFVARASADGGELVEADAARKIQLKPREVRAIRSELNRVAKDANRPDLIESRTITEQLPNGRSTEKWVLKMEPDVAEMVRAAEQEELLDAAHPLGQASE